MYTEDQLIKMIRKRFADTSARVGIGDDAAVIDLPIGFLHPGLLGPACREHTFSM